MISASLHCFEVSLHARFFCSFLGQEPVRFFNEFEQKNSFMKGAQGRIVDV